MARTRLNFTITAALLFALALGSHAQAPTLLQDAAATKTTKYNMVTYQKKQTTCWDTCYARNQFPELASNFNLEDWNSPDIGPNPNYQLPTAVCVVRAGSTIYYGTTKLTITGSGSTRKTSQTCMYLDNTGKTVTATTYQCACNPTCKKDDATCYAATAAATWTYSATTCNIKKCTKGCICSIFKSDTSSDTEFFGYTTPKAPNTCRVANLPPTDKADSSGQNNPNVGISSVCRI